MSANSLFSLNSTLMGGVQSSLSAWALGHFGVISKATAPALKGAFLFGATTASLDYAATALSENAKSDLPKDSLKRKTIDLIQCAFSIGSYYAVAQLGQRYFGMTIPNKYVHLLMASELIHAATSNGKITQLSTGMMGVIYTKALSIFMEVPCFEHAFYLGVVSRSTYSLLEKVTDLAEDSIKGRVKDLRYLFIYRISVYGLLTATSLFLTDKVSKYLHIETSSAYLLGLMASNIPVNLTWGVLAHLFIDIVSPLKGKQIADRLKDSQNINVQIIYRQIEEMTKWADNDVDTNQLQAILQKHPIVHQQLLKFFNRQVLAIFRQFIQEWFRGVGGEDIIVHSALSLASQAKHLMPILKVISILIGVKENKAGAAFILEVVLHQASSPVLIAFKEMNPEFIPFLLTKAVATYAVDSRYAVQDLPRFFTPKTKEKIVALRKQLLDSPPIREHYVAVLGQLNTIVTREQGEGFFSFESDLTRDQSQALTKLKEIGSAELQSDFIKVCAQNATEYIEARVEEDIV